MKLNSVEELLEDLRAGKMVVLVDDEDRENEGDLILPADYVTPQAVNFMALEARGLICLSLTSEQVEKLGLPLMVKDETNRSPNKTAFTVSIEAANGVSTGISAADRAHTIKVASNPGALPAELTVPGHVFPIRAQNGGVLKRAGHTEGSVDLMRLAGLTPAATICEIMNPDGTMARMPELLAFSHRHNLKIGTIESLIQYRIATESFVEEISRGPFHSNLAKGFEVRVFVNHLDGRQHLAFVKGPIREREPVMVRVQNQCLIGDAFQSKDVPTFANLTAAFQKIEDAGCGVLLYLCNEDMRLGLQGRMDGRDYGIGAQILRSLGLHRIALLSNKPGKRVGLRGYGLEIVESIPLQSVPDRHQSFTEFHEADL